MTQPNFLVIFISLAMVGRSKSQARVHQKLLEDLEKTQKATVAAYLTEQKTVWEEGQRPAEL